MDLSSLPDQPSHVLTNPTIPPDLSFLPDKPKDNPLVGGNELVIKAAPQLDTWGQIKDFWRNLVLDREKEASQAAITTCILESARAEGKSTKGLTKKLTDNFQATAKELGYFVGPTDQEMLSLGVTAALGAGVGAQAVKLGSWVKALTKAGIGVTEFIAIGEGLRALTGYSGLPELLPSGASKKMEMLFEAADFLAKGGLMVKFHRSAPGIMNKFIRQTITTYDLPQKVYISPEKIKSIFQTGEGISPEEMDIIKSLGLNGEQYRSAINLGITVEVPASKVFRVADRAWFAKLKSLFGMTPYEAERKSFAGEFKQAPAGALPEGEGKPSEVSTKPPVVPAEGEKAVVEAEGEAAPETAVTEQESLEKVELDPRVVVGERAAISEGEYKELEDVEAQAFKAVEKMQAAEAEAQAKEKVQKKIDRERNLKFKKEAEEAFKNDPVQQAIEFLKKGPGLNLTVAKEIFGENEIKELQKRHGRRLFKKSGYPFPPEVFAKRLGFKNVDHMAYELFAAPSKQEFIAEYIRDIGAEIPPPSLEWDIFSNEYKLYIDEQIKTLKRLQSKTKRVSDRKQAGLKGVILENTGQIKVGDALIDESEALRAAMKKAEVAARKAFSKGKYEAALREKLKQKEILERARKRKGIRREIEKVRSLYDSVIKATKIDSEYRKQALKVLEQFDLVPRSAATKRNLESLADFLARAEEQGEDTSFIPVNLIERLGKRPITELSFDELKEVSETVEKIVHLGKLKRKLISGRQERDFQKTIDTIEKKIRETATVFGKPARLKGVEKETRLFLGQQNIFSRFNSSLRGYLFEHIKKSFFFDALDGFPVGHDGICSQECWDPIKMSQDKEFAELTYIRTRLTEIFDIIRPRLKEISTKKFKIDGVDELFTKEKAILVALNSGSPDNLDRLKEGDGWSDEQIASILNTLGTRYGPERSDEWKFVYEVWDLVGRYWEEVNKLHLDFTGVPLKKAPGKYFHIYFDYNQNYKAGSFRHRQALEQADMSQYVRPGTKHGERIERKKKVRGMPLLLNFSVITRMLEETIHDISFARAIRDVRKIIAHPNIKAAIEQTRGKEAYNILMPWLKDIAKPGNTELYGVIDKILSNLRSNVTIAMLGAKIGVAAVQPISFSHTIYELGLYRSVTELAKFWANPWGKYKFATERSIELKNTMHRWTRDVAHAYGRFNPAEFRKYPLIKDFLKSLYFSLLGMLDTVARVPTWTAAYRKGLNELFDFDEAKAIAYADRVVGRTQPMPFTKDFPAIQRGSELKKLVTMFFSHFVNVFNLGYEALEKVYRRGGMKEVLDLFRAFWWVFVIPAIVTNMIRKQKTIKPEEIPGVVGGYAASSMILVRDVANSYFSGFDYSPTPVVDVGQTTINFLRATTGKGKKDRIPEYLISLFGYGTGLIPSKQAIQFVRAARYGDPSLILGGYKKKSRRKKIRIRR